MTIKQTVLISSILIILSIVLTFFLIKDDPRKFFESFIIIGPDVRFTKNILLR